jgi:hypothetical protein
MTSFGLWSVINTTWNTWFTTQYHMCVCIFKHIHNGVKNLITMYDNWELAKFSIYSLIGLHICILWRGVRTMSIYDNKLSSFTHGKVCAQMGSGQPRKCTTSDFHAVLFWFVYDKTDCSIISRWLRNVLSVSPSMRDDWETSSSFKKHC